MAGQNVETMRRAYEAFNRQDIPGALGVFSEQIEWNEPGGGNSPSGVFNGRQSVGNDVFSAIPQYFTAFAATPNQFIDAGDTVVVVGRFQGTAKSGQSFDIPFAHVWRMQNGEPVRFDNYPEAQEWAAAWSR